MICSDLMGATISAQELQVNLLRAHLGTRQLQTGLHGNVFHNPVPREPPRGRSEMFLCHLDPKRPRHHVKKQREIASQTRPPARAKTRPRTLYPRKQGTPVRGLPMEMDVLPRNQLRTCSCIMK